MEGEATKLAAAARQSSAVISLLWMEDGDDLEKKTWRGQSLHALLFRRWRTRRARQRTGHAAGSAVRPREMRSPFTPFFCSVKVRATDFALKASIVSTDVPERQRSPTRKAVS